MEEGGRGGNSPTDLPQGRWGDGKNVHRELMLWTLKMEKGFTSQGGSLGWLIDNGKGREVNSLLETTERKAAPAITLSFNPVTSTCTSNLWTGKIIYLCHFKPTGFWQFSLAAIRNGYTPQVAFLLCPLHLSVCYVPMKIPHFL